MDRRHLEGTRALVDGVDPDLFFPERGESTRAAKVLCAHCPVKGECLDYAIETYAWGIWGRDVGSATPEDAQGS